MRRALLAALLLAAAPAAAEEDEFPEERRARLSISAFGGEAFATGGSTRDAPVVGGELAYAFDAVEVGAWMAGYQLKVTPARPWSQVLLLRLTERFETHRGLEASFTFGFGAGRADRWVGWYQLALGARVALGGPLFLQGEIAFEQYDLLRLAAGLGLRF